MPISENHTKKIKVTFLPSSKQIEISPGISILEAAVSAGLQVRGDCGGKGLCGQCRLKVHGGEERYASPSERKHLAPEELAAGITLACQRRLVEDATIEIEAREIAKHAKGDDRDGYKTLNIESDLEKRYLIISPPSLEDQISDLERVARELSEMGEINTDLWVLSELPEVLRRSDYKVTGVLYGGGLLAVEPGDTTADKYGIAFDVGTTTVAGFLVDLNSGEVVATGDTTNYQQVFGSDVISRINYTIENKDGRALLQKRVMAAMNDIIFRLLRESGVSRDRVYEVVTVGNTTIIHLMLGLYSESIARSPFVPVFRQPLKISNVHLGFDIHSNGIIYTLPTIAGFLGADIVAAMLATHIDKKTGITLVVDIGTNGEIVLSGKGRILACSTAAGPAFEGARITCGMRAVEGAIEGIRISEDICLDVIGGVRPVGICGSGLIDAAAEMLRLGILDSNGRIVDRGILEGRVNRKVLNCIRDGDNGKEFILSDENSSAINRAVRITQLDIRELQLAKGAICAGIKVLLAKLGVKNSQIDRVFLAGAFGNYITRESAVSIGLFPDVPIDRIYPVGNAAGEGARMALASVSARKHAIELAQTVEHVELSSQQDFHEAFIGSTYFPGRGPENLHATAFHIP